jgi:RNA polymerase sigma factor (sigma-70 family)
MSRNSGLAPLVLVTSWWAVGMPEGEARGARPAVARTLAEESPLAARLQALDRETWKAFFTAQRRLVRGILAGCVGYGADVEDLTQQVFVTAASLVQSGRVVLRGDESGMRAWLAAIADRIGRAERRRLGVARTALGQEGNDADAGGRGLDPVIYQTLCRARSAWERLPERLQSFWRLRHLERMTIEEVAAATSASCATVKRRLTQADRLFSAMVQADPVLRDYAQAQERRRP